MIKTSMLCIVTGCIVTLSTACAPFKPSDPHAALCNELNSRIILNGNTSINHMAEHQDSEKATLAKAYEANGCDK